MNLEALLRQAHDNPDEDTPRLLVADWLEEYGDEAGRARAEFIRLQIERGRAEEPFLGMGVQLLDREWEREGQLREAFQKAWLGADDLVHFTRGWAALSEHAAGLEELAQRVGRALEAGWVEQLCLHLSRRGELERVLASPWVRCVPDLCLCDGELTPQAARSLARLTNLRRLTFKGTSLGDDGARRLAECPGLERLRSLTLFRCGLGPGGAAALGASRHLPSLSVLHVPRNDIGDAGLEALLAGGLAGRLRALGLRDAALTSASARALAACPALRHLEALVLEADGLGEEGLRWLLSSPYLAGLRVLRLGRAARVATCLAEGCRLPRLELLELTTSPEGVAALAGSPLLAPVTHLRLAGEGLGAESAAALARSPHVAQLRLLDLSDIALGDAGAAELAASPHLSRLRYLLLGSCRIGPVGALALAESGRLPELAFLDLEGNNDLPGSMDPKLLDPTRRPTEPSAWPRFLRLARCEEQDAEALAPMLLAGLEDASATVRAEAVWQLGQLLRQAGESLPEESRQLVRAALQRSFTDLRAEVRRRVVVTLDGLRHNEGERPWRDEILARALLDTVPDVHERARIALSRSDSPPSPAVLPTLSEALTTGPADSRARAAAVVARMGRQGASVAPVLLGLLADAEAAVRCEALLALFEVGAAPPDFGRRLAEALAGQSAGPLGLVRMTYRSLSKSGADPEARVGALRYGLASPDEGVRAVAAMALADVGPPALTALPDLPALLADPVPEVRRQALILLGRLGAPAAGLVGALLSMPRDPATDWHLLFTLEAVAGAAHPEACRLRRELAPRLQGRQGQQEAVWAWVACAGVSVAEARQRVRALSLDPTAPRPGGPP